VIKLDPRLRFVGAVEISSLRLRLAHSITHLIVGYSRLLKRYNHEIGSFLRRTAMPLQKGASCSVSEVSFRLRLEDCSAEEMEERQPLSVVAPSNSATHDVERTQRVEFVGMSNVPDGSAQDGMEWRRTLSQEQSSSAVGRLHRNGPVASTRALLQPRRSLLGKPLNYRAHRRDARLRRLQAKTYNFLERPKDWKSISYHLLV